MSKILTGQRLAEIRKQRGWTQQQMAEAMGTARSYIADVERGNKEPSFHFLLSLIETTGISADWLLGHTAEQHQAKVSDPKLDLIQEWLLEFWAVADEDDRSWLMVQMKRHIPPFQEWLDRRNQGGQQ
jgi:transcriptional regulator with XRE-family HTH domain